MRPTRAEFLADFERVSPETAAGALALFCADVGGRMDASVVDLLRSGALGLLWNRQMIVAEVVHPTLAEPAYFTLESVLRGKWRRLLFAEDADGRGVPN